MKQINIKALAQELNLSVSTISKALRDSYEISDETKHRVLELAAKLNYTPNPYASSLRGKKSRNIAIVIPEVADSFFSQAINGIESVAKGKGYHVLICLTHENYEHEQAILKEFQSGRVDGVLMSVSSETASGGHIQELIAKEVPVVFFDRALNGVAAARIVTDDFQSGYNATAHLIEQGCRNIAFLGVSSQLSISNDRMAGYRKAMEEKGLPFREVYCSSSPEDNHTLVTDLLRQHGRPDGILASVEKLATSVYQACAELQLSMPADVKLVCFSNLGIAAMLYPSLTTVTQPAFEMGKAAAATLLKLLEKKHTDPSGLDMVIPSELIRRGSSL
ncbi:LacI family DNA-binding transcriptional regulator [Chitinophaga barathri]|uniref:LacI family transcriptional regulator n=1 Tax=Chitinophaga barathri TaxID=1647451 RepID=A0A3N4MF42_9BACT|nr:LacI family DNA-binding transcriptional regulator [Chitinophaga barathri]RPD42574.1 LacI family transcriptional regulator [Chitinophaga barathri]